MFQMIIFCIQTKITKTVQKGALKVSQIYLWEVWLDKTVLRTSILQKVHKNKSRMTFVEKYKCPTGGPLGLVGRDL